MMVSNNVVEICDLEITILTVQISVTWGFCIPNLLSNISIIDFGACLTSLTFHVHQFTVLYVCKKRRKSKSNILYGINQNKYK